MLIHNEYIMHTHALKSNLKRIKTDGDHDECEYKQEKKKLDEDDVDDTPQFWATNIVRILDFCTVFANLFLQEVCRFSYSVPFIVIGFMCLAKCETEFFIYSFSISFQLYSRSTI